jgi:hypothetical protein
MAMRQDINFPLLLTVGVTGALLLFVIVEAAQAWFLYERGKEQERKWTAPAVVRDLTTLPDLKNEQLARLNRYSWVDKNKQTAIIPIDAAIEHVARNPEVITRRPTTRPAN